MASRIESPSSINTFKQCKRKYYYQYLLKLPTIPNIHQVRGNIAHSTLEMFYDLDLSKITEENYPLRLREAIQRLFIHYWNHYQPQLQAICLSKDQERFYFEETMLMLMNWVNHFVETITDHIKERNVSFGEAFEQLKPLREQELVSSTYAVKGVIDAIRYVEEEVHIIDYKTNASFEIKEEIKLQLGIYCLLYAELYRKMPSKVGIFFLRHKLKLMNVDEGLLELARREITMIHHHTSHHEAIEQYPRTISKLCKWSSGQCDFYGACKPHQHNGSSGF